VFSLRAQGCNDWPFFRFSALLIFATHGRHKHQKEKALDIDSNSACVTPQTHHQGPNLPPTPPATAPTHRKQQIPPFYISIESTMREVISLNGTSALLLRP